MRRGELLGGLAAATLSAPGGASPKEREPVVESLEIARVQVNHRGDWLLLRCKASNGLTGIGDASHGGDPKRQTASTSSGSGSQPPQIFSNLHAWQRQR